MIPALFSGLVLLSNPRAPLLKPLFRVRKNLPGLLFQWGSISCPRLRPYNCLKAILFPLLGFPQVIAHSQVFTAVVVSA